MLKGETKKLINKFQNKKTQVNLTRLTPNL